jgi:hypothetical protein
MRVEVSVTPQKQGVIIVREGDDP